MTRIMQVSDSLVVKADAAALWEQVADPTQMPRWSPENTGASTPSAAGPLHEGDIFEGTNRRGPATWVTESVVTDSTPGKRFAFTVRRIGPRSPSIEGANASWAYDFEDLGGATRVTETWIDDRRKWPDALAWVFDHIVTRGKSFADFQRLNIRRTLTTLKDDFEREG
ncbi:SRPBCC family protein [Brevibacterium oceani]|uniref:SRPBCC family protein n=1 Tax=Brevibacterium oceani TaxID=358099 RepID=UPI001B3191E8|nr:SRPBCC family protein [Brevibacterium oceani]